jgi:putative MFS transporter
VVGLFGNVSLAALVIAVPMLASAVLLVRSGIETRGRRLEDIQDLLADSASAPAMQP